MRTTYRTTHVNELLRDYANQPPAYFARRWGVPVASVYELARRHGIKRRAPNGQPVWRAAA